ncbi:family 20 glycosylhydrolase [Rheinheimera pleomorphica]|uniref:family 20 glycosylhydrolase n=1 Tax=Rheinheimera pleomorphica TaxID=2703963 RepID=UPI001420B7F7|nr:family 20 glycosylhydrolase [Rheinheimera pleomorphica]
MRGLILVLLCWYLPVASADSFSQSQLAEFARHSTVQFSVQSNQLAEPMRFAAAITLHNHSNIALPAGERDWQLYFHLIRRIDTTEQLGLVIEHVQGDLHRIRPTPAFRGLPPAQQLTLSFNSAPWMISYSDFMPRAFITSGALQPEIFANTNSEDFSQFVRPLSRPEQLQRNFDSAQPGGGDQVMTVDAASRYARNQALLHHVPASDSQHRVIPKPQQATFTKSRITLTPQWQLQYSGRLTNEAEYLQQQLKRYDVALNERSISGKASAPVLSLAVAPDTVSASEGYQLTIKADSISIVAADNAGVFYGIQTLLALARAEKGQLVLPAARISDAPRAAWRGMHYDMARNFHGKDVTLRLIDNMARYKLNKLHLHLTEDEGWRLQIPGLPELTEIGAKRCFDLIEQQCLLTQLGTGPHADGSGNGYYSTADFVEILQYAAKRHIEVIPEIDLPGHARAAVVAMQARYNRLMAAGQPDAASQYLLSDPNDSSAYLSVQNYTDNSANVCLESTYAFVDKVLYELQQLYRQAGVSLRIFHMGGDEVAAGSWLGSPACQQLFAQSDNGIAGVADLKPYFVSRVASLTAQRGLALAGWEDGLMYDKENTFNRSQFANTRVIANAWDNIWEWGVADRAYRLANNGYQVVLSPGTHLYFDHPHEAHPQERGYYWATRFSSIDKVFGFMPDNFYANADTTRSGAAITDLEKLVGRELPALQQPQNILGIQGQVWSETIRTAAQLEQMIYPRLLALAERAWHKADWEQSNNSQQRLADWQQFAARLANIELSRLAALGSDFYLPPPGVQSSQQGIQANTALPGLALEYSLDQGNSWQPYQGKLVTKNSPVWFRSRQQQRFSAVVKVAVQ